MCKPSLSWVSSQRANAVQSLKNLNNQTRCKLPSIPCGLHFAREGLLSPALHSNSSHTSKETQPLALEPACQHRLTNCHTVRIESAAAVMSPTVEDGALKVSSPGSSLFNLPWTFLDSSVRFGPRREASNSTCSARNIFEPSSKGSRSHCYSQCHEGPRCVLSGVSFVILQRET